MTTLIHRIRPSPLELVDLEVDLGPGRKSGELAPPAGDVWERAISQSRKRAEVDEHLAV